MRPSTIIVQAPHAPRSQHALVAGEVGAHAQRVEQRHARLDPQVRRGGRSPSAARALRRGRRRAAAAVCASSSATPPTTPAAMPVTPADFRKSRRLTLKRSGLSGFSSFGAMLRAPSIGQRENLMAKNSRTDCALTTILMGFPPGVSALRELLSRVPSTRLQHSPDVRPQEACITVHDEGDGPAGAQNRRAARAAPPPRFRPRR